MFLRRLLKVICLSSLVVGCESQFSFKEVSVSCEPPRTSARFGKSLGPVILSPDALQTFNKDLTVSGTCVAGAKLNISGSGVQNPSEIECLDGTFNTSVSFKSGDGVKELNVSQDTDTGTGVTDVRCFSQDSVPPKVTITNTTSASALNTNTIRVAGTCERGLNVIIEGPEVAGVISTQCTNGTFSTEVTFSGPDGNKEVTARQVDPAGNTGNDDNTYLTDTSAPIVTIDSPAPSTLTQGNILISGSCEVGPRVIFSGNISSNLASVDCVDGHYSTTLSLGSGDGPKTVIASQTDIAGNIGATSRDFIKDATSPTVKITGPAANFLTQGTINLTGICETGLPVNLGGPGIIQAAILSCIDGKFETPVALTAGDGVKTLNVSQTDPAGNSSSDSRNFIKDSTAPLITIVTPEERTSWPNQITLSGACETGINVHLSGDLAAESNVNCVNSKYSTTLTLNSNDGIKTIVATQIDLAGNSSTASRVFIRDSSGPIVAITSPTPNTYINLNTLISGTCENGIVVNLSGAGLASSTSATCTSGTFASTVVFTTGDGVKEIRAAQTDSAGNSGSDTKSFLIDLTSPVIKISSPIANTVSAEELTLSGTCEKDLTVNISGSGVLAASSTSCANGSFSSLISLSSGDGTKNVIVSQTDGAGNVGSDNRDFLRDSSAPSILITGPATNSVSKNGITLVGTCETGTQVNLSGTGISANSTTTCAAGTFSAVLVFSAGEGTKNIIASQTDSVGNTASDNRNFVRDSIAPVISITGPATGTIYQNGVTLLGTCESGLPVNLLGTGLGGPSLTTCTDGAFSVAITFSSGDGIKNIIASQTDGAGNTGTDNRNFTRDNLGPSIVISSPAANSVTRTGITLSGICETGLPIALSGAGLSSPASATCSGGTFSTAINFTLGDGSKNIIVSQTDNAGNTGSDARAFILDTTSPLVKITAPAANTTSPSGLTVSGTCESGMAVTLSGTGMSAPTTTACTSGTFSQSIFFSIGDGTKNIIATQTDSVGNVGTDNRNFIRDGTAPVITITSPAENFVTSGGITLQGSCETGLVVNLSGTGLSSPNSISCTGGLFSTSLTFTSGDGSKLITVSQTDSTGNTGSDSRTFVKDSLGPSIAITSPAANSLVSSTGTISGSCESGLPVAVTGAGITTTVNTSCSSGTFSAAVTYTSGDGTKTVNVAQTDTAGNTGSDTRSFVRDVTAPAIKITAPVTNTAAQTGVTLVGTCETGLAVNLSGSGLSSPTSTSCGAGGFSTSVTFTSGDGTKPITVSQTDASGNTGTDSRSFIRDTTAPSLTITSPAANSYVSSSLTLTGTCETGINVIIDGAGTVSATTTTCLNGAFSSIVSITNGDGSKTISVHQTDLAGNIGSASRDFLRDDSAPLIAITSPAANSLSTGNVTLSGTCESGLEVNLGGTGNSSPSTTTCTSGAFSANITLSTGDGTKNLTASQTDAAGNTGTSSRNVIRDNLAPVVAITSPNANTNVAATAIVAGTCESGVNVILSGSGLSSSVTTTCNNSAFGASVTFSNGDGTKTVIATQTDSAGNSGSSTRNFVRDTQAPAITITSPNANSVGQTGLTINGTCEAGLPVILNGAGVATTVTTNCTDSTFSAAILFTSGEGSKTVTASQVDTAGNMGSNTRSFIRDSTGPNITISAPIANTVSQTGVTISGACETGLLISLTGSGLGSPSSTTCSNDAYSVAITFSSGDGSKNIVVSQTDIAGNIGTANRDFIRDTAGPSVAITAPAASSYVGTTAVLTGTCETGLNVLIGGTGVSSTGNVTCSSGAFTTTITFTSGDGSKNVTATQTDLAGNSGNDQRTFIRDSTAPVVAITSPAANTTAVSSITIGGTCESGLTVTVSGTGIASSTTTNCVSGIFTALVNYSSGDGAKAITASQTDAAGNTGTNSRSFIKDSTAPTITISSPAANTYASTGITISGSCETNLTVTLSGTGINTPASTNCVSGSYNTAVIFSSGEGTKNIIASQTDSVGNTGTTNRDFVKDSIAPVVAITSPAAGTTAPAGITLSGNCESGLAVTISGDTDTTYTTTCSNGTFSSDITFSSAMGTKTITATQTDLAGNRGTASQNYNRANNAGLDSFTSRGPGGKVDILFVDDNSASMEAEQAALGSKFSSFATSLSTVDWQAGIITTDCTAGSPHNFCGQLFDFAGRPAGEYILNSSTPNFLTAFQNTIQRPETPGCLITGTCPSGREEGLKSAIQAMNLRDTDNAGFFRNDSDLAIVILTDEDESSTAPPTATTPTQLINNFKSIWSTNKKLSVYSIVVKPTDGTCLATQKQQDGNNASYGTYPDQLSTLTGGLSVSICAPDYSITLTQIGNDVTRLSKSVDLSHTPITGTVSIKYTPTYTTGFTVSGNRVTFDVPAPAGTIVEISYDYN